MNIHGFARATEDIDLFLWPEEENVARLKKALFDVWGDEAIQDITASDLLGDYPVVRYGPPSEDVYIDILTRLGERLEYAQLDTQDVVVQGVKVRVATPRALFEMKKNTVRPIDQADARRLARAFDFS